MASYQDLAASDLSANSLTDKQSRSKGAQSALAMMQADMDAAIKNKQHNHTHASATGEQPNIDKSNEFIAATVNEAGDRVLDEAQISRVIEMAWEDRTTFEAIEHSYGLNEAGVIKLMRQALKPSSFRLWRKRVSNRATKHEATRSFVVGRAYCKTQYKQR